MLPKGFWISMIQAGQHLVEQQHTWLCQHCPGNGDALLLATAQPHSCNLQLEKVTTKHTGIVDSSEHATDKAPQIKLCCVRKMTQFEGTSRSQERSHSSNEHLCLQSKRECGSMLMQRDLCKLEAIPLSPTGVRYPRGKEEMKSCAFASFAASSTCI